MKNLQWENRCVNASSDLFKFPVIHYWVSCHQKTEDNAFLFKACPKAISCSPVTFLWNLTNFLFCFLSYILNSYTTPLVWVINIIHTYKYAMKCNLISTVCGFIDHKLYQWPIKMILLLYKSFSFWLFFSSQYLLVLFVSETKAFQGILIYFKWILNSNVQVYHIQLFLKLVFFFRFWILELQSLKV